MINALLGPLASLASSVIEGQISKSKAKATLAQTEAEAKAEAMKTAATHDSKWEIMAESTKSSIRDEIVTIVVLIPVILVFIPGMEEVVKNGLTA